MTGKSPSQKDYTLPMLLVTGAVVFLIVFGGVPVAWLSKHGAEYGLGQLTWQLREFLHSFRPAA